MPNTNKKPSTSKWLALSRAICAELRPKVLAITGTPRASEVVNKKGAGGDETTYVDELSEHIFAKHLRAFQKSGEKFSLLSEEIGLVSYGSPYPLLVVDPIDGSINCKRGIPFHAVSIGVFTGPTIGTGVFGYVLNLANGDVFHAAAGSGFSYLNGKRLQLKQDKKHFPEMLLLEAPYKSDNKTMALAHSFISRVEKIRMMGSLALAVTYTATGAADMYLHLKDSRVIDYAGAKIILEEAGGIMSDLHGDSLNSQTIDLKKKEMLVASRSKTMHAQAVKAFSLK